MAPGFDSLTAALADRYQIEQEIGQGGMATVYLARDLKHDRLVAIKVLKPVLAAVIGAERFLGEIKTLANLQHPHILPLHDSGKADSFLYFVMPYVEGESLREKLDREKQLPIDQAVRIAREIAEALEYAHGRGLIHRDIKPANLLLHDGRVLVADFGIALAVQQAGGMRLTETGLSVGTPQYMSPEQATGDRELDGRSDLYSLGCVLYEMLTGDPPHVAGSAQAVLAKILTDEPPPPTKARPSIPANVDAAIRKALEKLPADRFGVPQNFTQALNDPGFRHGETTGRGARPERSLSRSISFAAGLLLTGAVVGLVLTWAFASRERQPDSVVRFPIPLDDGQRLLAVAPSLAIAPDGSRIAFVVATEAGTLLYTRSLSDRDARPVAGTEGAAYPIFSPDGRWLAFAANGKLQRVPVEGGSPLSIIDLPRGEIVGASWGPDDLIVYAQPTTGLSRIAPGGGDPEILTELDRDAGEFAHAFPSVTPDGGTVLFTIRAGEGSTIAALSLETGDWRSFRGGSVAVRYMPTGHLVYPEGGGLVAEPFDLARLESLGTAIPILDSVVTNTERAVDFAFFDVSADGSLAYVRGRYSESLAWIDADGSLTPWGARERGYWYFTLSPDGRRVAATIPDRDTQDEEVWILEADGSGRRVRITNLGDNISPIWTPDGQSVTYASNRAGDMDLYRQDPDPGAEAEPLLVREYDQFLGSWHPDGTALAFVEEHPETGRDIWLLTPGPPAEVRPLLRSPANETQPAFSIDGRWLAYASDETGRLEVYVMAMPDGIRRAISVEGGSEPVWSRDGREIYFHRGSTLFAVVFGEERGEPRPDRPRRAFDVSSWSNSWFAGFQVTADGRALIPWSESFTSVEVVLNWHGELAAVLGAN